MGLQFIPVYNEIPLENIAMSEVTILTNVTSISGRNQVMNLARDPNLRGNDHPDRARNVRAVYHTLTFLYREITLPSHMEVGETRQITIGTPTVHEYRVLSSEAESIAEILRNPVGWIVTPCDRPNLSRETRMYGVRSFGSLRSAVIYASPSL